MKPESLENLLRRARTAPPSAGSEEAPPFFARRVTGLWLSGRKEYGSPWEIFALRGAALSAAAMILAVALSVSLLPGNNDENDLDDTAEVFSLP